MFPNNKNETRKHSIALLFKILQKIPNKQLGKEYYQCIQIEKEKVNLSRIPYNVIAYTESFKNFKRDL